MEGYGNENPGAFQPTRPLRGATEIAHKLTDTIKFQPTRPLRGATVKLWHWIVRRNISTHAPLAGRDVLCECNPSAIIGNFNPRAPCGARRRMAFKHCGQKENFNPRAPCGARRSKFPSQGGKTVFQPTRPLRGATTRCRRTARRKCISTHAPLAGRDEEESATEASTEYFNPRAPCGARQ